MVTIDDLEKMALELRSFDDGLKKISHYKVNQKTYKLMKTIDSSGIVYHAEIDALLLNGKPVLIDNELEDGIATYQRKESESIKAVNIYSSNKILVKPRRIEPVGLISLI